MTRETEPEDRFLAIYAGRASSYHELVTREDYQGNLTAALQEIGGLAGRTVVELGAGTGRVTRIVAQTAGRVLAFDRSRHMLDRAEAFLSGTGNVTLAVADNVSVPLSDGSADVVIEGWSYGHGVTTAGTEWKKAAALLVAEMMRLLVEGGTGIIIETLGTGCRAPAPPGALLPLFYAWLETDKGFERKWIRTDYRFESMARARELVEFFFGAMMDHDVLPTGEVIVPECTGIWHRRKGPRDKSLAAGRPGTRGYR